MEDNPLQELKEVIEKGLAAKFVSSKKIATGNNDVYMVDFNSGKSIVKIYQNRGANKDNELLLYRSLPVQAIARMKKLQLAGKNASGKEYAVFEYIEGRTLLDLAIEGISDEKSRAVVGELREFLEACFTVTPVRFGSLNDRLEGSHENYLDFLFDYQVQTARTLFSHPQTRSLSSLPFELVSRFAERINVEKGVLSPIDLNMKNQLITSDGKLKILDPGAVLSSNPLATWGEFGAHTLGTNLWNAFVSGYSPTDEELSQMRMYSALSNMNTLAFIVRSGVKDITKVKPWGNPNTFLSLIESHRKYALEGKN